MAVDPVGSGGQWAMEGSGWHSIQWAVDKAGSGSSGQRMAGDPVGSGWQGIQWAVDGSRSSGQWILNQISLVHNSNIVIYPSDTSAFPPWSRTESILN